MPRKPVSNVIEHRITLGDYERERLNGFLESQKNLSAARTFQAAALPVVNLAAATGLGFGLYFIAQALADLDPTKGVRETLSHYANNPKGGFNRKVQPDEEPYGSKTGEVGPEPPESINGAVNWIMSPVFETLAALGVKPKERDKKNR